MFFILHVRQFPPLISPSGLNFRAEVVYHRSRLYAVEKHISCGKTLKISYRCLGYYKMNDKTSFIHLLDIIKGNAAQPSPEVCCSCCSVSVRPENFLPFFPLFLYLHIKKAMGQNCKESTYY